MSVKLEGIFVCVRCGAELTELVVVKGEGTVCADTEACRFTRIQDRIMGL